MIDVGDRPGLVDALTRYERNEQSRWRVDGNVNGASRKEATAVAATTPTALRWIARGPPRLATPRLSRPARRAPIGAATSTGESDGVGFAGPGDCWELVEPVHVVHVDNTLR